MAEIVTKHGTVLVDDDIAELINKFNAKIIFNKQKYPVIQMPIHIAAYGGTVPGMHIDHINRNTMDARRSNLRLCTPRQNVANTGPRKGQRYKGISVKRYKNKDGSFRYLGYRAKISLNGKDFIIGVFASDEEAAYAYDLAAQIVQGEYAYLNYPNEKPQFSYVLPDYILKVLTNESNNYVGMPSIEPGIFLRPNGKYLATFNRSAIKKTGKVFECIEDARAWRASFSKSKESPISSHTAL